MFFVGYYFYETHFMTLLNLLLILSLFTAHPLHVSVTNLEINNQNKEISVMYKIYTDDFSLLFYHLFEKEIKPVAGKEFTPAELALVNRYISAAFILESGNTHLPLQYIRKEQNEETVNLYYKGTLPSNKTKSLMLTNALLLDLFEDQTNLVIITHGKKEQGISFDIKNMKSEIDLDGQ